MGGVTRIIHLTPDIMLKMLKQREFYTFVPVFGPMLPQIEAVYARLKSENLINEDGTLNKAGCQGCKARQFRRLQANIVDVFVNALLQLQNAGKTDQLNLVKEYLATMGYTADIVQVTYTGPCVKMRPTEIKF